jgi:hypothetical protein
MYKIIKIVHLNSIFVLETLYTLKFNSFYMKINRNLWGLNMKNDSNKKERSASSLILLTLSIAFVLLIGWSVTGLVLGGTTQGGKDGTPSPPEGPGDDPYPGPPGPPNPDPDPDPPPPDNPGPDDPEPDDPPNWPTEPVDDSDNDYIPDEDEPSHSTDQYDWDSDNDHLSDGNEDSSTDPNMKDSDNDGI